MTVKVTTSIHPCLWIKDMGFKKPADVADIISQIRQIAAECKSPYNDGFTGSSLKTDLYQIKFFLDEVINECPEFEGEQDWLEEHRKELVVKYLKK